jgi:hypothetical protein
MDRDRVLPMGTVMFLVFAVGGMLLQRTPLRSVRPPVSAGPETHVFQAENVNARLWQDPVAAVETAWNRRLDAMRSADGDAPPLGRRKLPAVNRLEHLGSEIVASGEPATVHIMPVIMTEGYHSVGVESRRRERQAVVRALAADGCVPESDKRLGFFGTAWTRSTTHGQPPVLAGAGGCARPFSFEGAGFEAVNESLETAVFPVPFEWFRQDDRVGDGRAHHVLALWIAEDKLNAGPVTMLSALVERIRSRFAGTAVTTPDTVAVVGPATSGGLQMILQARRDGVEFDEGDEEMSYWPRRLIFASSRATAPDDLLGFAGDEAPGPGDLAIAIRRTIADDRQALSLMADELALRVPPSAYESGDGPAPTIALFGEWDSAYGRAMLNIFQAKVPRNWQLRTYSLLRGVDGSTPHSPDDDPAQTMLSLGDERRGGITDIGILAGSGAAARTMPFGRAQLDAFRRQADRLTDEIEHAPRPGERGRLVAVGVLGADIFDKLLVIQAMRERYPGVMLFSTDLDAMFLHPSLNRWCRNLLIASGHGLVPDPPTRAVETDDRTVRFPPFRDTYQTATFAAARLALGISGLGDLRDADLGTLAPRMYEVGRERAYDLTPTAPNLHRPSVGRLVLLLATGLLLALLVVPLVGSSLARNERGSAAQSRWRAVAVAVVVVGLTLVVTAPYRQTYNDGEPLYLFAGISVWPTMMLRVLAIGIALYSLFQLPASESAVRQRIASTFSLPSRVDQAIGGRGPGAKLRDGLRAVAQGLADLVPGRGWTAQLGGRNQHGEDPIDAASVWRAFLWTDRPASRYARVALATAVGFAIGILLAGLMPYPLAPARGMYAQSFQQTTQFMGGVLFFLLFFTALDGMRRHKQLLDLIGRRGLRWPAGERRELRDAVGVSAEIPDSLVDRVRSLELAARATEPLNRKLVLPFVVMFVMLVGRLDVFDNWGMPALSMVFMLYLCVLVLAGGIVVYRRARNLRSGTLAAIDAARIELEIARDAVEAGRVLEPARTGRAAQAASGGDDGAAVESPVRPPLVPALAKARLQSDLNGLQRLQARVSGLQTGVFQGWTRHPLVRAGVLAGLVAATFLEQIVRAL